MQSIITRIYSVRRSAKCNLRMMNENVANAERQEGVLGHVIVGFRK